MQPLLRQLTTLDIPSALELSTEAGWNQTADDWRMLLELEPRGCFALECQGNLAATTTLLCYGDRLAWIGMVLTRPEFRRRGFATLLMRRALEIADSRQIATIKLDATEMGRPLYESLGFETEQIVERWSLEARPEKSARAGFKPVDWRDPAAKLDRVAFAAGRSHALQALASQHPPISSQDGYLFARPGRLARYLGPCIATSPTAARQLIEPALADSSDNWFWDLLPENAAAASLARDLGFSMTRRLVRMRRGEALRGTESLIYAIAGFELG